MNSSSVLTECARGASTINSLSSLLYVGHYPDTRGICVTLYKDRGDISPGNLPGSWEGGLGVFLKRSIKICDSIKVNALNPQNVHEKISNDIKVIAKRRVAE